MRLSPGARIAIVGAGPSGIVTARHALEAGFDVTVLLPLTAAVDPARVPELVEEWSEAGIWVAA